jgi:hypothetical protein
MPITLHFDHSIDVPGYEEDSDEIAQFANGSDKVWQAVASCAI